MFRRRATRRACVSALAVGAYLFTRRMFRALAPSPPLPIAFIIGALRTTIISVLSFITAFMTPERWKQVDRLLQEALEREPAERAAFLDQACGGAGDLRREVESLLAFHERADTFIEKPPAVMAAALLAEKEWKDGQT